MPKYTHDQAIKRIETSFRQHAEQPLFKHAESDNPEILPHIYTSGTIQQGNVLSHLGSKYALPMGTNRVFHEDYEEVIIPPAKPVPPRFNERLVPISELEPLIRGSFVGYTSLNRIQSIVYPTAFGSNENLLICGLSNFMYSGKTDVAMLTLLRVLDQHRTRHTSTSELRETINKDAFKIIYVAPMKALAAEIVRKFERRLRWLGIRTNHTGDMQMTKAEIDETQIIVTTPEKWDVVTRKPTGEGEVAFCLKLLIIDEVHLLNEERGAVIETIVARTLRQVETSQSVIRIVGLSATLPNYIDVAEFLSVSRHKGLFYFDSSFRPIPLEQHFLGIKGKPGSAISRRNFDRVTFEKVSQLVASGHQVMVFVHARKETVKTALALMEAATVDGNLEDFSCEDHPQWQLYRRSVGESRNKEMKRLYDSGFGIHHAGMLRSDRTLTEKLFLERALKVLCCTATLAWGVNLPAHAVIIKGTQIYDSSRGTFVDLSVLDVLQIFGRAGRPGLESSGEGYICTTEDKLTHYLESILSQIPIESQFQKGLLDALNAEISLGTVSNVGDAFRWLGYTYLQVRMRKNPLVYGIFDSNFRTSMTHDGDLAKRRHELVIAAARQLSESHMIVYDEQSETFRSTDLGRIAARYYIRHSSIKVFNETFKPIMSEADVLAMLSKSTEFDQIQVRENEIKELEDLMNRVPCDVKGGTDTHYGKVNILLQAYISGEAIQDFALVSDMSYVAQNGGRIMRALFEIGLSKKWASVSYVLSDMSKAIELRMWPYEHPLKQANLKTEVLSNLDRWAGDWSIAELAESNPQTVGEVVHLNNRHGTAIITAAKQFPSIDLQFDLRPLTPDILKICISAHRNFVWNTSTHGNSHVFLLWVEDRETSTILQSTHLIFRSATELIKTNFIIAIAPSEKLPQLTLRTMSDHWIGADEEVSIPIESAVMPRSFETHTRKLDLPFLPLSVLNNPIVESIFSHITYLNGLQSHVYWGLLHSYQHSMLCSPAGSGKSTIIQMALWMTVIQPHFAWALVVAPRKSVATELLSTLRRAGILANVSIENRTSSNALVPPDRKAIYVVTAGNLLQALFQTSPANSIPGLDLVICENLEQLSSNYELSISLLRHATQSFPTRFIATTNSLNDPHDLADWLSVGPYGLHSFKPSDRDQSLTVNTSSFSIPYSSSLMKAMAKPTHAAVREAQRAIVFVPSRGHCRTVALDLLTQCALEAESTAGYLPGTVSEAEFQLIQHRFASSSYYDFISKGVSFFHGGLDRKEQNLMLQFFVEGILRVLIVPREACWSLPVRADVVVVMGCQYLQSGVEGSDRQIRDYEVNEVVEMQGHAVRQFGLGQFYLFCQPETKDTYTRFLNDGIPLESSLLETSELETWLRSRVHDPTFDERQALDILSFTYLARRIKSNPSYYDCSSGDDGPSRVVDRILGKFKQTRASRDP
ncbi:Sec63 Brl domain containing protein [Amanita muscaria]